MTAAIAGHGLSKRYRKLIDRPTILGSLVNIGRPKGTDLWALKDVDIEIQRGETVGIIGRNGSGKTTLLKLLSGVTQPTTGHLEVSGRVAPLLGVGVGFRKEMSGRENVLLNGMLLGLTREQVESKLESIVDFAELWDFIDTPVKFYSSGMYLRLGFAVAVHTEPDIMLVDEILAVGDLSFQTKCLNKLRELQSLGTTIVLVSHALHSVRSFCGRGILLSHGMVVLDGDTESVIARYFEQTAADANEAEMARDGLTHMLVGGATILEREVVGPAGPVSVVTDRDTRIELRLRVRFDTDAESPVVGIDLISQAGAHVYGVHSPLDLNYHSYRAGDEAELTFSFLPRLVGGTYRLTSQVMTRDGRGVMGHDSRGVYLIVDAAAGHTGVAFLEGIPSADGRILGPATPADLAGRGTSPGHR